MLKIRLQGTTNELKWFRKILEKNSICPVQHNLFIESNSEKLKPMTSRQFVGKWKGAKFQ